VVGDMMLEPTQPLSVLRVVQPGGRASATIPFDQPGSCIALPTRTLATRCWWSPRSVRRADF
jgi:hypothetical protein